MCLEANEDILEQSSRRRDACFGQLGLLRNVFVGRIRCRGMERNVVIIIITLSTVVVLYIIFYYFILLLFIIIYIL